MTPARKPPDEALQSVIHVRVTDDEHAKIKAHCEGLGATMSAFIRAVVLAAIGHKPTR